MTRIKQLRQVAAQQLHGQGQPAGRRLDALDEEQALTPGEAAAPAEAPAVNAVNAPAAMEGEMAASAEAGVPGAAGGSSGLVMGGVALGAIGLAAVAASGGSGAKSGDLKPPAAELPKPEIPRPLPEPPKPDDGKPLQPEVPKPEDGQKPPPEIPKPDVELLKPEQPGKPETPQTPVNPNPDKPTTPEPEEPTIPTPQRPPAPTVALAVDSGRSASDRYTNQADVQVSGLLPGATWKYSVDGGITWREGGIEGKILAGEFPPGDGERSVSVVQINSAGMSSNLSVLDFHLDTTAPQTGFIVLLPEGYSEEQSGTFEAKGVAATLLNFADFVNSNLPLQWSLGPVDYGKWEEMTHDSVDFSQYVSPEVDKAYLLFRIADLAGNFSSGRGVEFYGLAKFAPPPIPRVEIVMDSGTSTDDRVTNDATLRVNGLVTGMTWKYSLDNGVTWKTGGADHQIAASEFGGIPGLKNVQVVQVNASNKESAAAHFDFTLQPDDITGVPGAANFNPTVFTGTSGMDKLKVNTADGKKLSIVGYDKSQGDVIDLSAVLAIPNGANVSEYIRTMGAGSSNSGYQFSVNLTGNPAADSKDFLVVDLGSYAAQPQVTILYNGGQTVI